MAAEYVTTGFARYVILTKSRMIMTVPFAKIPSYWQLQKLNLKVEICTEQCLSTKLGTTV